MPYFLFIFLYICISNWLIVKNVVKGNILEKKTKKVKDIKMLDFIFKKTGKRLPYITLQTSDKSFGYCGGLPGHPVFVLSTTAYKRFTGSALDWLVLHEMGHYTHMHSFIMIIDELIIGLFGIWLISFTTFPLSLLLSSILAILLSILTIQIHKLLDFDANHYAVTRMNYPLGMAEGAQLLIQQAKESHIYYDSLLMKLFYPWNYIMWHMTIQQANHEYNKRRTNRSEK